jgi:hypothetical protein
VRRLVAVLVVLAGACSGGEEEPGVKVTVLRGEATNVTPNQNALSFVGKKVAGPKLEKISVNGSWIVKIGRAHV